MKNKKGFYVYFYYSEENVLLYVGRSVQVGARFYAHQEDWMEKVKTIGVREYQNEASMKLSEKYYIAKLKPIYNIKDATDDRVEIEISDSSSFELMSRDEFINKYCQWPVIRKKKPSFNEWFGNLECNKVRINEINLFDEEILINNLDETVFLCDDFIFCFNQEILDMENEYCVYEPITNMKIQKTKKYLKNNDNLEASFLTGDAMPLSIYFKSPTASGGFLVVSSLEINKEGMVAKINFSNLCYLDIDKEQLIIRFDQFVHCYGCEQI